MTNEEKYLGQGRLQRQPPAEPEAPPVPTQVPSPRRTAFQAKPPFKKVVHVVNRLALCGLAVGTSLVVFGKSGQGQLVRIGDGVLGWTVGTYLFFWLAVFFVAYAVAMTRSINGGIRAASTPIPEPFQLIPQLEAELGRPVSLTEALAVHQYLTSQRNQAMAEGAIAFFLVQDAAKRAQGHGGIL
jgi:hypothetical protein